MSNSSQDLHKKFLGKHGENAVVEYLQSRGMRILKQNYKTPFGEADVVATDGDETVFVEVKTRTSDAFGEPKEAVTRKKQNRYRAIAKWYGANFDVEPNARFDVAEVTENGTIEYYENAF